MELQVFPPSAFGRCLLSLVGTRGSYFKRTEASAFPESLRSAHALRDDALRAESVLALMSELGNVFGSREHSAGRQCGLFQISRLLQGWMKHRRGRHGVQR